MKVKKIVIIGGSAGSLSVILELLNSIKSDLINPLVIVVHRSNSRESDLTNLLGSKSHNEVCEANCLIKICNKIYLAPSDYHLLIDENEVLSLEHSEKVKYSRPSIDVSFESFSSVYKERLVGVVLSGANEDGAEGAWCIKQRNGCVIVQNPDESESPYMPIATIKQLGGDCTILSIEDLINEIKNHLL